MFMHQFIYSSSCVKLAITDEFGSLPKLFVFSQNYVTVYKFPQDISLPASSPTTPIDFKKSIESINVARIIISVESCTGQSSNTSK